MDKFGIILANGGGDDYKTGIFDIIRGMTETDFCADFFKAGSQGVRLDIGAAHRDALFQEHPRNGAHSDAANTNKMNPLDREHERVPQQLEHSL
jgi:hypothetical protein